MTQKHAKICCTMNNQFRFENKHSVDMFIFSAKSIMKYYTEHDSLVFTCFFYASKSF